MTSKHLAGWMLVLAFVTTACGSDDGDDDVAGAGGQGSDSSSSGTGGSTSSGTASRGGSSYGTEPLTGTENTWSWIDLPDTRCRDGSTSGIGVNLSSRSPNVMLFLDQGGACFNSLTCDYTNASYSGSDFAGGAAFNQGIFNRSDAENPVKDYSFVLVPYCTGDVYAGNNPSATLPGVTGTQMFVGYQNLDVILSRVVATFPNATQVLLTGSSAGGFGAAVNADHVARAFGNVPVTVLDDSGPALSKEFVSTCLQQQWTTLWKLSDTVLADCGADCPNASDFMLDLALHHGRLYPPVQGGFISSTADSVIRFFFGFGLDNCLSALSSIPASDYEAGLEDLRQKIAEADAPFATFYLSSSSHMWLLDDAAFATEVGGVTVKQWVKSLLAGTAGDVGP